MDVKELILPGNIPGEIFDQIGRYLSIKDRVIVERVNKTWRQIMMNQWRRYPNINTKDFLHPSETNTERIICFFKSFWIKINPYVESLTVQRVFTSDFVTSEILRLLRGHNPPKLTKLTLEDVPAEAIGESMAFEGVEWLDITIRNKGNVDYQLARLIGGMPYLNAFSCTFTGQTDISGSFFPQLSSSLEILVLRGPISLSVDFNRSLQNAYLPNLKNLTIQSNSHRSRHALSIDLAIFPRITKLDIVLKMVSRLESIQTLQCLESLHVASLNERYRPLFLQQILNNECKFRSTLQELHLPFMDGIMVPEFQLAQIGQFERLEKLVLVMCRSLTINAMRDISAGCSQLRHLYIAASNINNEILAVIGRNAHKLQLLALIQCPMMSLQGLKDFLAPISPQRSMIIRIHEARFTAEHVHSAALLHNHPLITVEFSKSVPA